MIDYMRRRLCRIWAITPNNTEQQHMDQITWNRMTPAERDKVRSLSGLSPQLVGLEGWRVEVVTKYGETRRFIVGRSTGWIPCHVELHNRNSIGGIGADKNYASVRKLYRVRGGFV